MAEKEQILALHDWYRKKIAKQIGQSSRVRNNLYNIFFVNIIIAFFILILIANNTDDSGSQDYSFLFFMLIIPAIGVGLTLSATSELNARLDQIIETCKILERNSNTELYQACDEIITKMKMPALEYLALYCRDDNFFPGIIERTGITYLLIPRNFIKLLYTKPVYARAILVHEFSHIKQKDANNFLLRGILAKKGLYSGLLMLLASIGIAYLSDFRVVGVSMISLVGIPSFFALKALRIKSEELADTSVLIFDDGRNLIEALKEYAVDDERGNVTHDSPKIRVTLLLEKIAHYNLYSAKDVSIPVIQQKAVVSVVSPLINDYIQHLHDLLATEKRKIFSSYNEKIPESIQKIAADTDSCRMLAIEYKRQYKKELIEDILSTSSSLATINQYIQPLIDLNYCEAKYPYKVISL
jgi:uncharacterized integral membrane protein